jgi:HTH-type transcriptional regulator / antitoxin HigA
MTNKLQNEYHPNYVSSPGETLLETLEALGMTQVELARCMDYPVETINGIIQGKMPITADIAKQLEHIISIPASFWLKMDQYYQEFLAQTAKSTSSSLRHSKT